MRIRSMNPNRQVPGAAVLVWFLAAAGYAQTMSVESFAPSRVRLLDGPFRRIQELHRAGLVGKLEPDRLLFPFRRNAGLPIPAGGGSGYGGWDSGFLTGHFAGHYLSAASRMYAATGDATFRAKVDYMVEVLAECQKKLGGGYLSAFPTSRFDNLESTPKRAGVEYYTIHKILAGLLDANRYCDNRQALAVAAKMSDYFASRAAKLTGDQIEAMFRTDYTANPQNEFGGMGEVLVDLYLLAQSAGDPDAGRHLKLASSFNREWFLDPLLARQDRLNGMHANTHIPQAISLARFAQFTGDERAGAAAEFFWKAVTAQHSFANGSHGFAEKFRAAGTEVAGSGDAGLSPLTGESCGTYNMLRLSRLLFERGPSAAIGDYYENALYNHILTTIAPDTGKVVYFTPLRPGDFRTYIDQPYCCLGTGLENAARFADAIYFHRDRSLWVNLFIPTTLDWREQGMKLRLKTRYPESGIIRLAVDAVKPVNAEIHLRIPAWVQGRATVRINGRPAQIRPVPGAFLTIARTWSSGDVLELTLPLALRLRVSMDDPETVSFFYGPVLLAGKLGREGMPASEVGDNANSTKYPAWPVPVLISAAAGKASLAVRPVAKVPLAFSARMLNLKDRTPLIVEMAPLYQVHHERYAVYWKVLNPEQMKRARGW